MLWNSPQITLGLGEMDEADGSFKEKNRTPGGKHPKHSLKGATVLFPNTHSAHPTGNHSTPSYQLCKNEIMFETQSSGLQPFVLLSGPTVDQYFPQLTQKKFTFRSHLNFIFPPNNGELFQALTCRILLLH